jgi:hypothetical protein
MKDKSTLPTRKLTITLKTVFGLEEAVMQELEELGFSGMTMANRAVYLKGDWEDVYKLNLHCRCVISVLVKIAEFELRDEDDLYKQCMRIDWPSIFSVDKTFAVKGAVFLDMFNHTQFPYLLVKDAIVDTFRNIDGNRPDINTKSPQVVIEEFLDGPEVSLFGISDGIKIIAMQPAQDFKRAFDGDLGPNTGGMGAYSPLPWAPTKIMEETLDKVLNPTIQEMAARGTPFVGLLYAGLALTSRGTKVIEFNARFGDPETQVLLPRLKTPLAQLLMAAATKNLENFGELEWSDDSAVTVVLASAGYPADPKLGEVITEVKTNSNSYVFHAGTEMRDGVLHSSGGRVLTVTGLGSDLTQARDAAYRTISRISLPGSHYRSDIALNASVAEKGN